MTEVRTRGNFLGSGPGKLTGLVSSARETWFYGRVKRETQEEKLTDEVWWARFGKPTKNLEPS